MVQEWGFYGRQAEIKELARHLQIDPSECPVDRRFFVAVGIAGRRGVGKNTLLERVVNQYGYADRLLVVRLPPAQATLDDTYALFLRAFRTAIARHAMTPLLADMPPRDPELVDEGHMADIITHLVHKDIIVCLDEVHTIIGTTMPTILMGLIDDLASVNLQPAQRGPGKLVLMGSHQQKFAQLQAVSEPLHERFDSVQLMPWSVATVMDIARTHGWDRRPRRLHALWTAFDGMPREWERFARRGPEHLRQWSALTGDAHRDRADDQAWCQEFVRHERHMLDRYPRRHWDSKAYIELPPSVRDAIIWMGQHRTPGQIIPGRDIVHGVKRTAHQAQITLKPPMPESGELNMQLEQLDKLTRIVQRRDRFIGRIQGDSIPRWTLNDNTTLFQLAIAPDLFRPRYIMNPPKSPKINDMMRALETLEGESLERFVTAWLGCHPHVMDAHYGALPPAPKGQTLPDIDVLVRLGQSPRGRGPHDLLVLGNAKRDSTLHNAGEFQSIVERFMAQGTTDLNDRNKSVDIEEIRPLPRCLLFVSPIFDPDARSRIQAAGHLAFDLPAMATEIQAGWPRLNAQLATAPLTSPEPPQP